MAAERTGFSDMNGLEELCVVVAALNMVLLLFCGLHAFRVNQPAKKNISHLFLHLSMRIGHFFSKRFQGFSNDFFSRTWEHFCTVGIDFLAQESLLTIRRR